MLPPFRDIAGFLLKTVTTLEVCMGMGNPVGMGIPWESHGNGNNTMVHNVNGSGNGNNAAGMGMTYF